MKTILTIIQIILSIALTVLIFLQSQNDTDPRGNIMSTVSFEKRGWEKVIFYITIVTLIFFIISSVIQTTI